MKTGGREGHAGLPNRMEWQSFTKRRPAARLLLSFPSILGETTAFRAGSARTLRGLVQRAAFEQLDAEVQVMAIAFRSLSYHDVLLYAAEYLSSPEVIEAEFRKESPMPRTYSRMDMQGCSERGSTARTRESPSAYSFMFVYSLYAWILDLGYRFVGVAGPYSVYWPSQPSHHRAGVDSPSD